jgi:hypothetical protein
MDRYKDEVDEFKEEAVLDFADKFINLANEMAKSDNSGAVGVGLRYAAARYCAFEASLQTDNLVGEKEKHLQLFTNIFQKMLQKNLDDYIMLQFRQKTD